MPSAVNQIHELCRGLSATCDSSSLALYYTYLILEYLHQNLCHLRKCNLSNPPKSWLTTKALGIMEWATAGISDQGEHFCVNVSSWKFSSQDGQIQKHSRIPSYGIKVFLHEVKNSAYNQCILDDDQIHVCFPYCAKDKQKIVDFNDPETHLNVTSFADPKVWCAIYIGIDPFVGSSYLYEIQLAKIIR
ncbi:unnamed protein product [Haemonchus placei]|uniref:SUN domain-containing protein n=1 Tax=Haemonchus placei TaxID=6290 RepID=A0A0N4W8R3_HAEPC|nr:unnamed protein product [Haemonchus placei]